MEKTTKLLVCTGTLMLIAGHRLTAEARCLAMLAANFCIN